MFALRIATTAALLALFLHGKGATAAEQLDSLCVVSKISITGNKTTRAWIVRRELPFAVNDTIPFANIEQMALMATENLDKTSLFNFVFVNYMVSNEDIQFYVDVEERWYIWPFPIFEFADRNLSVLIKEGNYSRVNFGGYLRVDNFRGLNEQLRLRAVAGYRNQLSVNYTTYNLNRSHNHGVDVLFNYVAGHEIPFKTVGNEPVYFTSDKGFARNYLEAQLSYLYRPRLHWFHRVSTGFTYLNVLDTVVRLNPLYLGQGNSRLSFFELRYEITHDKRNSKVYPLRGHYFKGVLHQQGVFTFDDFHATSFEGSVRGYFPLGGRFYSSVDVLGKIATKQNLPYILSEAIGFSDYIRGFEYYVLNGSRYMINKSSLKYELMPTRVVNLPLVPDGKFKKAHFAMYLNIFADTGYVIRDSSTPVDNSLEGNFLYGWGVGLDLVTYYDNIFRVEYTINKFGESGFFLHIGAPFLRN
ncbi:MAG: BamA/TamA family outer membrane protein [Bacteroidales bacterium]|nr:BamA/TamA family outer membrane protein [Bacteroidales bacterium]MBN2750478.1 BamA/TamA family outer membrane protein [Bacteroidales bacterium]